MKTPGIHLTFALAVGLVLLFPPGTKAEPPSSSNENSRRSKPQVIYHLPRTAAYGATLHSQAKTERELPVERPSQARASDPEVQQAPERAIAEAPKNEMQAQRKQAVRRSPSKASPQRMVRPARGKGNGNSHGGGHGRKK
jgi:hypothetical protein